jgi:hypothetical protein
MIDITILKVEHRTVKQARKLLPYVQACDVFGIESAGKSEQAAMKIERLWEDVINSNLSRTQFAQWEELRQREARNSPEIRDYAAKADEYLFLEKKPMWYFERYSDSERQKLAQLEQTMDQHKKAFGRLLSGDHAGYFESSWQHYVAKIAYLDTRDEHIARQLDVAEHKIRERYPSLSDKVPLRYALYVGSNHLPERFTQVPVNIVSLIEEQLHQSVFAAVRKGIFSEEFKKELILLEYFANFPAADRAQLKAKELPELISRFKRDFLEYKLVPNLTK